jgi:hypothetical protein
MYYPAPPHDLMYSVLWHDSQTSEDGPALGNNNNKNQHSDSSIVDEEVNLLRPNIMAI